MDCTVPCGKPRGTRELLQPAHESRASLAPQGLCLCPCSPSAGAGKGQQSQGTLQSLQTPHLSGIAGLRSVLACWVCHCDSEIPSATPFGGERGRKRAEVRGKEVRNK